MDLNAQQNEALHYVLDGHNLVLCGQAGTGKTHTVSKIVNALEGKGKKVALTATTGIACCLYSNASTIHRWSGIGDGRHSVSDIRAIVENNVGYEDVKERIKSADVLIIDECSMLSTRLFHCLDEVCRLRKSSLPFGGLQLVLVGDFTQLAPVPNQLYGEEGGFCFESPLFQEILPHTIMLTEVKRQSDRNLINTIHEVAEGNVSTDTELFLKRLRRPLPPGKEPLRLYANNDKVDEFNRKKIIEFPGEMFEFQAKDEGDSTQLSKLLAPKTLWLKKDSPVMLLRNLSNVLVNGLRGHVCEIRETGPVVVFPSVKMTVPLTKLKFSVFSPSKNADIASRVQYPIKLSFAITIHKSQGLTLDRVEIDCHQIFKPGQLGVALGRAKETRGLRVINFNTKQCVIPQPATVKSFLERPSSEFQDCLGCCHSKEERLQQLSPLPRSSDDDPTTCTSATSTTTTQDPLMCEDVDIEEQLNSEEFDSEFDELIMMIDEFQKETVDLPDDLNLDAILSSLKWKTPKTKEQESTNKILSEIDNARYIQFCRNIYSKLEELVKELNIDPSTPVKSKLLTDFYSKDLEYQLSTEYRMICLTLFENMTYTDNHNHICFNILKNIRTYILKKKADLFPVRNRQIADRSVLNSSEARVRYVGGYCVAKVKHAYRQKKKTSMYKVDEAGQAIYEESIKAVNILDSMTVSEHYILTNTEKPESLLDVSRKQGQNRSLTNIPDDVFQFFRILTEKCLKLLIDENMNKYGSSLFEELKTIILNSTDIIDIFKSVVCRCVTDYQDADEHPDESLLKIVYGKLIKLFLMVMVNQFRKDVLESFHIEKKMAHRKQVRVAEKTKGKRSVTIEQPSTSKEIHEHSAPKRKRKPASQRDILEPLFEQKDQSNSDDDDDDDVPCKVCKLNQNQTPSQTEWINCDECKGWLHRRCAGLNHHLRWKKFTKKGVKFNCSQCE